MPDESEETAEKSAESRVSSSDESDGESEGDDSGARPGNGDADDGSDGTTDERNDENSPTDRPETDDEPTDDETTDDTALQKLEDDSDTPIEKRPMVGPQRPPADRDVERGPSSEGTDSDRDGEKGPDQPTADDSPDDEAEGDTVTDDEVDSDDTGDPDDSVGIFDASWGTKDERDEGEGKDSEDEDSEDEDLEGEDSEDEDIEGEDSEDEDLEGEDSEDEDLEDEDEDDDLEDEDEDEDLEDEDEDEDEDDDPEGEDEDDDPEGEDEDDDPEGEDEDTENLPEAKTDGEGVVGDRHKREKDDTAYPDPDEDIGGISTPPDDEEMPLTDHIEEMIQRLAVVILVGSAATALGLLWASDVIAIMWADVIPESVERPPHVYHPLELWLTRIKVAALLGILVALPMLVYQAYLFMKPGLYPHERKYYLAAVPTSVVLAFIGMLFSYFVILPILFAYFTFYSEGSADIAYALGETFDLVITLTGFLAITFQIPLFVILAVLMGVTTRQWLAEKRLYFWAAFAGLAFMFTMDPTFMAPIFVAITMILLFEGTLLLLKWSGR